jgi:hypothetical protein
MDSDWRFKAQDTTDKSAHEIEMRSPKSRFLRVRAIGRPVGMERHLARRLRRF